MLEISAVYNSAKTDLDILKLQNFIKFRLKNMEELFLKHMKLKPNSISKINVFQQVNYYIQVAIKLSSQQVKQ